MKGFYVYAIKDDGEKFPMGVAFSRNDAEAMIVHLKENYDPEGMFSYEIIEENSDIKLKQDDDECKKEKQKKKGVDEVLMSIRDEILLCDESKENDERLNYIEEELELLYRKGKIKDPARFLNRAYIAKGFH